MSLQYKVITVIYEETVHGDGPFEKLERWVNEHISEGWKPLGGVALTSAVGPKTPTGKDNWFLRVAQAMTSPTFAENSRISKIDTKFNIKYLGGSAWVAAKTLVGRPTP